MPQLPQGSKLKFPMAIGNVRTAQRILPSVSAARIRVLSSCSLKRANPRQPGKGAVPTSWNPRQSWEKAMGAMIMILKMRT